TPVVAASRVPAVASAATRDVVVFIMTVSIGLPIATMAIDGAVLECRSCWRSDGSHRRDDCERVPRPAAAAHERPASGSTTDGPVVLPLALRGRHIREKFAFARTAAFAALPRHRDAHCVERVLDGITDRAQQKGGSLSSGLRCGAGETARYVVVPLPSRFVCQGFCLPAESSQSANFIDLGTKEFVCSLSHTQGNDSGDITMPTPKEYRLRARECLELTD